jgi:hypothetical protein
MTLMCISPLHQFAPRPTATPTSQAPPSVALATPIPEVGVVLQVDQDSEEFALPPGEIAAQAELAFVPHEPVTVEDHNSTPLLSSIYVFQGIGHEQNVQK